MEERVRARLTASQGRKFGLTVGGAFLLLTLVMWWRGHPTLMTIFGALGGSLALGGLLIPTYMGPVERGWMALAHAISKVTTPIVMGVIYLLVLTPVGLLRRIAGGNPMVNESAESSYWKTRKGRGRTSSLQRQF